MSALKRDIYWDSLKFILIVLVVFGHVLGIWIDNENSLGVVYRFIYIFHMPLFCYISGYFTKKIDRGGKFQKNVLGLLELLICFQTITLLCQTALGQDMGWVNIISPHGVLWYLFALIVWRCIIQICPSKLFDSYRKAVLMILISVVISVAAGFVPVGHEFALQRILAFLPFFLLGYISREYDVLLFWMKSRNKWLSMILLVTVFLGCYYFYDECSTRWFYMCHPYGNPIEALYRLIIIVLSFICSVSILSLWHSSEKLALLGKNTMGIYIYHAFIVSFIGKCYAYVPLPHSLIWCILYSVLIVTVIVLLCRIRFVAECLRPIAMIRNRLINRREVGGGLI